MGDEKKREGAGMSRRTFALGVGGAGVLLAMGGLKLVPAEAQVRPPGGQDESRLVASCIRCERCVEACPRGALRPAHIEDGIVSVRTPTTNFNDGWCDFCADENDGVPLCVAAVLIREWCLAWDKNNGCRFCYDACPYEAIELDENGRPVVVPDNCNGCGACQSVCVSQKEGSYTTGATSRAIIVVPESEA